MTRALALAAGRLDYTEQGLLSRQVDPALSFIVKLRQHSVHALHEHPSKLKQLIIRRSCCVLASDERLSWRVSRQEPSDGTRAINVVRPSSREVNITPD
jgi:hypothetical protein